jgi:hypothetical protein
VDKNGSFLLAVADGRTIYDQGMTLEEMALYMINKGAVMALNGDGGGSSVLVQDGEVISQNKGSDERVVNHAVLIWLKKKEAVKPVNPIPTPTVKMLEGAKDVAETAWYAKGIEYAICNNLMSVDADGNFNPNMPLTRAMAAQLLMNIRATKGGV